MPSQGRARLSFAACRLCKVPGCWRLMGAWSSCLEWKAPAAAPRATSSVTSEVERWHASPPAVAVTTGVALTIKTSRAWCCSMAAAERPRTQHRNYGRSSSRRARHAWASGAEGMTMTIDLPWILCAVHADTSAFAPRSTKVGLLRTRRIVNYTAELSPRENSARPVPRLRRC